MPIGRTFSFEDNDEQGFHSHGQEPLRYSPPQHQQPPVTNHDPPVRDIISPPPQYSSLPPQQDPVSPESRSPSPSLSPSPSPPPSPPPARYRSRGHQRQRSDVPPRRPVASRLPQDSSIPPPPPPHRSSPTRGDRYLEHTQDWHTPPHLASSAVNNFSGGYRERGFTPSRGYYPAEPEWGSPVRPRDRRPDRSSHGSNLPLVAGAASPGTITPEPSPDPRLAHFSGRSIPRDESSTNVPPAFGKYLDSPYHNSGLNLRPGVTDANINPYNIADDGDDGFIPDPKRRSMLDLVRERSNERFGPTKAAGTGAGGGAMGAVKGLFGRNPRPQASSGSYNRVGTDAAGLSEKAPRSEWLARQTRGNNRMRWVVGAAIITVVVLAIIAGIIGGVIDSRKSAASINPNSNDNTAAGDIASNGDLGLNSPQIKALLNNPNLHKVFPGIDYTPWGTQYPLCLTYPPSPNNVTRDMAVLSQLTNVVRLYGNDCNQTQMVLHSIDRLQLTDMKVWLGVWIDTNETTTDRQIAQMYEILADTSDLSIFKGVIVGNEVLYRAGLDKAQSEIQLIGYLTDIKARFQQLGYNLPVATSDLGDSWNAQLVEVADLVMSNIHPFFAGVTAAEAASWTWSFWQNNDVVLTEGMPNKKQVISETGWPSAGGRDCGGETGECYGTDLTSDDVAIASIDGMNTYMHTWVCQALENGTDYFWFEAFDEPWKIIYDQGDQNWETEWGLMDAGRNLKPGLKIPDCGGRTVDS